eukprot:GHVU01127314.1.p1 GENE.GHVU01127314.1~~GHVU01127314.1.p1  ORF type:complete len:291 (+),score=51.04 GHVU01127314.1:83-874(+)
MSAASLPVDALEDRRGERSALKAWRVPRRRLSDWTPRTLQALMMAVNEFTVTSPGRVRINSSAREISALTKQAGAPLCAALPPPGCRPVARVAPSSACRAMDTSTRRGSVRGAEANDCVVADSVDDDDRVPCPRGASFSVPVVVAHSSSFEQRCGALIDAAEGGGSALKPLLRSTHSAWDPHVLPRTPHTHTHTHTRGSTYADFTHTTAAVASAATPSSVNKSVNQSVGRSVKQPSSRFRTSMSGQEPSAGDATLDGARRAYR